jgi:membrane protein implicated in regulation of membrane protease activity
MRTFPFAGLLAGFTLWSGAFLLLYATQATGCKLGWQNIPLGPVSLLRIVLSAILLSALALFYLTAKRWLRPTEDATDDERQRLLSISARAHMAATASTLVTFAGIFWLSLC